MTGEVRCIDSQRCLLLSYDSCEQDPIGFWDPLGLSADKAGHAMEELHLICKSDLKDEATFKRRRAVEIKHGRIARA